MANSFISRADLVAFVLFAFLLFSLLGLVGVFFLMLMGIVQ